MRNKFPGQCYRCGKMVAAGDGHSERHNGGWRTQHATCAIFHRNLKYQQEGLSSHKTQARGGGGDTLAFHQPREQERWRGGGFPYASLANLTP